MFFKRSSTRDTSGNSVKLNKVVTLFLRESLFSLTVLLMYGIPRRSMRLLHQLFLPLNVDLSYISSAHDIV